MPSKQKQANKVKLLNKEDQKEGQKQEDDKKIERPPPPQQPETINERSKRRFYLTNPGTERLDRVGFAQLTGAERKTVTDTLILRCVAKCPSTKGHPSALTDLVSTESRPVFQNPKTERDFLKTAGRDGLPIRGLRRAYCWGKDKYGRDAGDLPVAEFEQRSQKAAVLTALEIISRARSREIVDKSRSGTPAHPDVYLLERERRVQMAELRKDLYGERTGPYALDPEWEDIIPIEQQEPDGALAAIAYPEDYAEAVGYLRAIMAKQECSARALRLTESIIRTNPAHYTVWLYRLKIIATLNLPIEDEVKWLNEVALKHLKNYQIWHHRQMLLSQRLNEVAKQADPDSAKVELVRSERAFITRILAEDAKNYHVWSYRQELARELSLWDDEEEMTATTALIDDDVRNNSAWSHRFFLVFSNPATCSPEGVIMATEPDPVITHDLVDREVRFAQERIRRAPQNPSGWNYMRGVLTKGSRRNDAREAERETETRAFIDEFVAGLGGNDGGEDSNERTERVERVGSTHALEMLADTASRQHDKELARQCWRLLETKYDAVRAGYWRWRIKQMEANADADGVDSRQ